MLLQIRTRGKIFFCFCFFVVEYAFCLLINIPVIIISFAFVEFEDRRDAEDAFEKFDGFSVEGRRLRLDW